METVFKKKEQEEVFSFPCSPLSDGDDGRITFTVVGQTPERSLEDRSVYLNIKSEKNLEREISMWLQGEDAISFGLSLIKQGQFALEANMINHQKNHMENLLFRYIEENRVKLIVYNKIDEHPVNYGEGFHLYKVTPIFYKGKAPKYNEDFCYEDVYYFSPLKDEFSDQIKYYTKGVDYILVEYINDKKVNEFIKEVKENLK